MSVPLYIAGPDVQPRSVSIACAICDSADQIHAPVVSNETGAAITLSIENTGSMGTTVINHNLTLRTRPEGFPFSDDAFSETADSNDNIQLYIGAHSQANLTALRNELTVFLMRHGGPMGSSIGPVVKDVAYLYGHFTYRSSFYLPRRRNFCFKYVAPYKGLPENWGICPNDILAKVEAASSTH